MPRVIVSGGFDDLRSMHVRFLHEAARRGPVHVLLHSDDLLKTETGRAPKFGLAERKFFLEALRYVKEVRTSPDHLDPDSLPPGFAPRGSIWAVTDVFGSETEHHRAAQRVWCAAQGLELLELSTANLSGFPTGPEAVLPSSSDGVMRALATGSFDWLHTGHVQFFQDAAAYGELTVVVGHDANIRLLKGDGHPVFSQEERRYMVGAMRSVAHAVISTGSGWLDAEPEMRVVAPRWYIVNEDGDKPEKRRYCEERGIEYVVLRRNPREGLPRRTSTDLRGF